MAQKIISTLDTDEFTGPVGGVILRLKRLVEKYGDGISLHFNNIVPLPYDSGTTCNFEVRCTPEDFAKFNLQARVTELMTDSEQRVIDCLRQQTGGPHD